MTTQPRSPLLCFAISMVLLCASACGGAAAPYVWVDRRIPEPKALGNLTVIGVGDLVSVMVYGEDKMSTRGRVLPDGTLTIPILGAIPAAGKNAEQLTKDLETQLTKYVQEPNVTVTIEESQISVAVIGEVKQPGVITLATPATVLKALATTGGLTDFADPSAIYVLRTTRGETTRIRFKYSALVDAEPAAIGFKLKTGDTLVVE